MKSTAWTNDKEYLRNGEELHMLLAKLLDASLLALIWGRAAVHGCDFGSTNNQEI